MEKSRQSIQVMRRLLLQSKTKPTNRTPQAIHSQLSASIVPSSTPLASLSNNSISMSTLSNTASSSKYECVSPLLGLMVIVAYAGLLVLKWDVQEFLCSAHFLLQCIIMVIQFDSNWRLWILQIAFLSLRHDSFPSRQCPF